jgi:hypothetical protein
VVQLYVGFPASVGEPPSQLKGFRKISLEPGQTGSVALALDLSSFASWSATANAWVVAPGTYTVRVGTSSRDLPLEQKVSILPRDCLPLLRNGALQGAGAGDRSAALGPIRRVCVLPRQVR